MHEYFSLLLGDRRTETLFTGIRKEILVSNVCIHLHRSGATTNEINYVLNVAICPVALRLYCFSIHAVFARV